MAFLREFKIVWFKQDAEGTTVRVREYRGNMELVDGVDTFVRSGKTRDYTVTPQHFMNELGRTSVTLEEFKVLGAQYLSEQLVGQDALVPWQEELLPP